MNVAMPMQPGFFEDPYPYFTQLRAQGPAVFNETLGMWLVGRHADVVHVSRNPQLFSSRILMDVSFNSGTDPELRARLDRFDAPTVIMMDPPDHRALRRVMNKSFTPRVVAGLEPWIQRLTKEHLTPLLDAPSAEWMEGLAVPLPLRVIAELLGVEPELWREFWRLTSDDMKLGLASLQGMKASPELDGLTRSRVELLELFERVCEDRRARPREDFVSLLVAASDGDLELATTALARNAQLILSAGNETTRLLLGSMLVLLAERPDLWSQLKADPGLVPLFIEELLRLRSSTLGLPRVAREDTEISGVSIPKGARVMNFYASACRDERVFQDAPVFDMHRPDLKRHVAFGTGIHVCLGAPLARLEVRVVLEALLREVREIELTDTVRWRASLFFHGPTAVPVRLHR